MKNITKKLILILLAFSGFNIQNSYSAAQFAWEYIDFDSLKGGTKEDIESLQSINDFGKRVGLLNNELKKIRNFARELGLFQDLETNIENLQRKLDQYLDIRDNPSLFSRYARQLSKLTLMIQNLKEIVSPKKEKEQKREAEDIQDIQNIQIRINNLKTKLKRYRSKHIHNIEVEDMNNKLNALSRNLQQEQIIDKKAIDQLENDISKFESIINTRLSDLLNDIKKQLDNIKQAGIADLAVTLGKMYANVVVLQGYIKQGMGTLYESNIDQLAMDVRKLAMAIENKHETSKELKNIIYSIEKKLDDIDKVDESQKSTIKKARIEFFKDELKKYKAYSEIGIAMPYAEKIKDLNSRVQQLAIDIIGQEEEEKIFVERQEQRK